MNLTRVFTKKTNVFVLVPDLNPCGFNALRRL